MPPRHIFSRKMKRLPNCSQKALTHWGGGGGGGGAQPGAAASAFEAAWHPAARKRPWNGARPLRCPAPADSAARHGCQGSAFSFSKTGRKQGAAAFGYRKGADVSPVSLVLVSPRRGGGRGERGTGLSGEQCCPQAPGPRPAELALGAAALLRVVGRIDMDAGARFDPTAPRLSAKRAAWKWTRSPGRNPNCQAGCPWTAPARLPSVGSAGPGHSQCPRSRGELIQDQGQVQMCCCPGQCAPRCEEAGVSVCV